MDYKDYLPTKAGVCVPFITEKTSSVPNTHGGSTTLLRKYNGGYTLSFDGVAIEDDTPEYGEGAYASGSDTYEVGDYVQINELGLKYRYTGASTLTITSESEANESHPMLIDIDGNFSNIPTKWVKAGVIDELLLSNGSTRDSLTGGVDIEIPVHRVGYFDRKVFVALFGFKGYTIKVKEGSTEIISLSGNNGEALKKDRFSMLIPMNVLDLGDQTGCKYSSSITIELHDAGFGDICYSSEFSETTLPSSVGEVIVGYFNEFGYPLLGNAHNRVSSFQDVLSDASKKSMVTESYDVFEGHFLVEEEDFQAVEYSLAKATQGDYVFHIGATKDGKGNPLFDQRVYLGKIKYRSPIEDNSGKFKINISGQSLAYNVENPLIAPDSTDGVPL